MCWMRQTRSRKQKTWLTYTQIAPDIIVISMKKKRTDRKGVGRLSSALQSGWVVPMQIALCAIFLLPPASYGQTVLVSKDSLEKAAAIKYITEYKLRDKKALLYLKLSEARMAEIAIDSLMAVSAKKSELLEDQIVITNQWKKLYEKEAKRRRGFGGWVERIAIFVAAVGITSAINK